MPAAGRRRLAPPRSSRFVGSFTSIRSLNLGVSTASKKASNVKRIIIQPTILLPFLLMV
uniref:Uncharacterized protein n=1 Tax=Helianthus annuus TaxID=4232 RepID=A0A251VPW7_HELAN